MGYTTDFKGRFTLDKPLAPEHAAYLKRFSETRRMAREVRVTELGPDPIRRAAGIVGVGVEGGYFVGGAGGYGQEHDVSITNYNGPPCGQPGLWCSWAPTEDGAGIEWNESEKFYYYTEWLQYLCDHFLEPWGYTLSGRVTWRGEEHSDIGTLTVRDNLVVALPGQMLKVTP